MTDPVRKLTEVSSSNTTTTTASSSSASTGTFRILDAQSLIEAQQKLRKPADVVAAVHAHLNAVRKLGRTNVTIGEVALALGLTAEEVQAAVIALKPKGVKTSA